MHAANAQPKQAAISCNGPQGRVEILVAVPDSLNAFIQDVKHAFASVLPSTDTSQVQLATAAASNFGATSERSRIQAWRLLNNEHDFFSPSNFSNIQHGMQLTLVVKQAGAAAAARAPTRASTSAPLPWLRHPVAINPRPYARYNHTDLLKSHRYDAVVPSAPSSHPTASWHTAGDQLHPHQHNVLVPVAATHPLGHPLPSSPLPGCQLLHQTHPLVSTGELPTSGCLQPCTHLHRGGT
jgi:hypothetical protein